MNPEHLKFIACPQCKADLQLRNARVAEGRIESGQLDCHSCRSSYPITGHIPRFVPANNYANSFGLEWTRHARTQYDSHSGAHVSRDRFFQETKWSPHLVGQSILEVGSGSGRFTEWAVSTGAMVVSLDYSYAVDANYATNGHHDNLLIVQGDIYHMPFRPNFFDKLFCIGVLQHTPDVEGAFFALPQYLRDGGELVIDVYRQLRGFRRLIETKYWVRPFSKRVSPEVLYRFTRAYVAMLWPMARLISRLPYGRHINRALLIADYHRIYHLDNQTLKEWAILDTFDMLAPAYDSPQSIETVQQWFKAAQLDEVEVHYGFNGIEGRGKKRAASAQAA